jgi:opacity protein-like surface antigen
LSLLVDRSILKHHKITCFNKGGEKPVKHLVKIATMTAVLSALAAPAFAEEVTVGDTYFKLSAGALIFDDLKGTSGGIPVKIELDTGWTVSGAADFDSGTAGGITVPINGDLSSLLTMVNANFHPNPGGGIDPYVGAGIGMAFSEIKVDSIGGVPINSKDSSDDLALQGTAGVNMALGGGKLGAQYRYIWTDTGGSGSDDITGHALTLHYIFSF